MPVRHFDIIVVTDARLVGGGNKSLAQEIQAHSSAGYSTGLISLDSPAKGGSRPIDMSLMSLVREGKLSILRPDHKYDAGLVIARGPSIFGVDQSVIPQVRADHWLLIANAFNTSAEVSGMLYDPFEVQRRASELFESEWTWTPLSEVVRQRMLAACPNLSLSATNWSNIINIEEWWIDRPAQLQTPIRLGRHSRDATGKWPATKREIFNAYTGNSEFRVSIMGGAKTPRRILGRIPKNWSVTPFNSRHPRDFLKDVDIYPYFHHPDLTEAFGRSILEAIATGAIAILPHYFGSVYSHAATYADSAEVKEIAFSLAADPDLVREKREAARSYVEENFSYASHVKRIESLIGAHRPTANFQRSAVRAPASLARSTLTKFRVMFCSGIDATCTTRVGAVGMNLPDDIQPYFLTLADDHRVLSDQGFPVEHFPARGNMGFTEAQEEEWEQILIVRIRLLLERVQPTVVVIDLPNLPRDLHKLRRDYPETVFIRFHQQVSGQTTTPAESSVVDVVDFIIESMDAKKTLAYDHQPFEGSSPGNTVHHLTDNASRDEPETNPTMIVATNGTIIASRIIAHHTRGAREVDPGLRPVSPERVESSARLTNNNDYDVSTS